MISDSYFGTFLPWFLRAKHESPGSGNIVKTCLVLFSSWIVASLVCRVIYRLYFHPLASIPGPKLAACTWLVEFWYNTCLRGSYYRRIDEYHQKYGPIVRVTPDEVHLRGIEGYELVYKQHKFPKDADLYSSFSGDDHASLFIAASIHESTARRRPLAQMFSARAVGEISWLIQQHVDTLCSKISSVGEGVSVDMHRNLRWMSLDVLSHYAFGESFGLLTNFAFAREIYDCFQTIAPSLWPFRMLPKSVVYAITHIGSGFPAMQRIFHLSQAQIRKIRAVNEEETDETLTHRTIFHELMNAEFKLGDGRVMKMSDRMLSGEAASLTFASAETTGSAMEMTLLGILADRDVHRNLRKELEEATEAAEDDSSVKALSRLPYLTSCIKEGLRLSHGALGRLPRVVNAANIEFQGYKLPIGTVVSSSNYNIHRNPVIFPSPNSYRPERWLQDDSKELNRYLLSFGKGHRSCLGLDLAWAELYATVGTLIRKFPSIRLAEGSVEAVEEIEYEDYFLNYVATGGRTLFIAT